MTLLFHELTHLLTGLGLGNLLSRHQKLPHVVAWALVASLLTDADHIVDYLRWVGPRWDPGALSTGSYFRESGTVMLVSHSWELAVLLVVIGLQTATPKYRSAFLGLGVGLLGHLAVDQVWYNQPWAHYFLTARILHGFADSRLW